ncbi:unannotated protein [freshwater metagenome]|uniref:Unannotated protein n=1 Tax=freshwater metagenome TaxID=449393 RepID=A0A6J7DWF3_9ZZZZ
MNGMRMNQFVAPTSFITSISLRLANIAVRIVFQIRPTAVPSRTIHSAVVTHRMKPDSLLMTLTYSAGERTSSTPGLPRN